MKNKIFAIGITLVLISIYLSGCEEIETNKDYKFLSITAKAWVGTETESIPNMLVEIQIFKDGVEQKDCLLSTHSDGYTETCSCLVKVYKEQEVRIVGNLNSVLPQEYEGYSVYGTKYQDIPWNTWSGSTNWGETEGWSCELHFDVY